MIIKVTEDDIKRGDCMECQSCPIAIVIKRAGLELGVSGVSRKKVELRGKGTPKHIALPKSARNFIERFDAGEPVKPFSFRLAVEK